MGVDRLKDLKASKDQIEIDIEDDADEEDELQGNKKNGTGFGLAGTEVGSMQEFLKIIEIVKKNIVNIREATGEIIEINQKFILATTEKQEDTASEGLSQIIINGNKNAKTAQTLLKDLNKEILELEKNNSLKAGDLRIRKNLVQTITKKYIDVLKEYQNVQNKSKELKKKRAVKRVQQVKPDATPEEIDAVIKTGGASNIMKQTILQGDASDVIKTALENVSSKYQDVLKLEASVNELSQMFQDFALIIEQQGELLDQIEYQVKATTDYVDEANVELDKAIDLQISVRKKQCCIIILVIILIIIIIVIVLSVVKPGASTGK